MALRLDCPIGRQTAGANERTLRFAAFRGGAFASIQFQKPSLSFQREGRSSRAVRIAASFAFEISGKCTVMNSSGSPSLFDDPP